MGKKTILRAVAVGALVLPHAAGAQETAGGMTVTLGVEERLSAGRNLVLETPAEGRTFASDTRLSFGVTSVTPLSRFSVLGAADLRLADEPGGNFSGIARPRLDFVYAREGAQSAFELTGSYRRDRVDFLRDLTSFLDSDGVLDLPDGFDDFEGEGTRDDYNLDLRLDLGTAAPLGVTLEAWVSGEDYRDTTAPALVDSRSYSLAGTARLRFSPVSEGRIRIGREIEDEDDAVETRTTADRITFGLAQEIDARARLDLEIGFAGIETETTGGRSTEEGLTGRIGYEWDMPDGRFDALLETTRSEDGARTELSFGRVRDLPLGALTARIGISQADFGDPALIGSLAWTRELPDGGVRASLDHRVTSSGAATEETVTSLALGWSRDITAVSGISLDFSYAASSETGANDTTLAGLSASYRHDLTEDWALRLGLAWRMRDEATVGSTSSEEVFLSIGREFTWLR